VKTSACEDGENKRGEAILLGGKERSKLCAACAVEGRKSERGERENAAKSRVGPSGLRAGRKPEIKVHAHHKKKSLLFPSERPEKEGKGEKPLSGAQADRAGENGWLLRPDD